VVTPARCRLLDANVLIALAWPQHVHHAMAHAWFERIGGQDWASCAATQLAFIRISSNPKLFGGASPRAATEMLRRIIALPGHQYWADTQAPVNSPLFDAAQFVGHKQVTDLYLLVLTQQHQGVLATLNTGLSQLLPDDESRHRWIEWVK
jgi:toxin-antitoxin system PIN domain toxin